jgi:hypothetical protein
MLPPFPHPPSPPRRELRVSIVITNRDYEAYLPAALASALQQRDADVEVIVVDDGSTDRSREIIEDHRGRVRPVLLDGRGQKAAFNAGFGEVSGDVVMFLDADDELAPGTAAEVLAAFAREPAAARVVFRLEVVDAHGQPTGARVPSAGMALAAGDVRRAVLAFPDDLGWPPTSGNAFATWALRRVMPIPIDEEKTGADSWLHPLIPLLGPVVALDGIHGLYRLHDANAHAGGGIDIERSRLIMRRARGSHRQIAVLARELGLGPARPRSVTIAAHRLLSLRLGGPGHPVAGDSRRRALGAGLRAAMARFDVSPAQRLAYAGWFVLVALAPRSVVRALGETFLQPLRPSPLARAVSGS